MKKIAFLSILAGLFMVGCTEMAQPADPQINAQEELITISGVVTATAAPVIDLAKVESMIALPFHPSNAYTIHELQENAAEIFAEIEKKAKEQFGEKVDFTLTDKIQDGKIMIS